jgi:hypothetical protein
MGSDSFSTEAVKLIAFQCTSNSIYKIVYFKKL